MFLDDAHSIRKPDVDPHTLFRGLGQEMLGHAEPLSHWGGFEKPGRADPDRMAGAPFGRAAVDIKSMNYVFNKVLVFHRFPLRTGMDLNSK